MVVVAHECSHHGRTGTPGIPARNGFNGFLRALPGDRACLSPSSALLLADLTPASRRQDHTTSPSAATSFVRAPLARPTLPASRPNVRDDGQRPSSGRNGAGSKSDLGLRRSGIFLQRGLDTQFTDLPVGQISARAGGLV